MSTNDKSSSGKAPGSLFDRYTVAPQQNSNGDDSPFYKSAAPSVSLPKGGGALKGIDEKFSVNAVNGTAGIEVALPLSPGRGGFTPALSLSYNSGSGNSAFGLGWNLGLPSIRRKTDKQLPRYYDSSDSDTFVLAGAEDLVPALLDEDSPDEHTTDGYFVKRYIPRIEGLFARIEFIRKITTGQNWWRVTTKDNITTYYGLPASENRAVIADPADNTRVFEWLPTLSVDHKGNVQYYQYLVDTNSDGNGNHDAAVNNSIPSQLSEKNRLNGNALYTQTYLKRVLYCNTIPYFVSGESPYEPVMPHPEDYLFLMEAVWDYGDHSSPHSLQPDQHWPARSDAFSDFHAGFEIRTYRKCKNVLMFHDFRELDGNDLVRVLELKYKNDSDIEIFTETDYITEAVQRGYQYNAVTETWQSKALPAMTFDYQPLQWNTDIHKVSKDDFVHAPQGLTGPYQWIDFEGEGISGILTEQANGWFYKNNLGNGNFDTARTILSKPNFAGLGSGLQWQDLDADGRRQVVAQDPVKGYWELDDEQQWQPFKTFARNLNIDWGSPFTRMLDLNGDGKADVLLTEDRAWTWYENIGKEGFRLGGNADGLCGGGAADEEKGPALLLRDNIQSIFLADMNGDGMTDLVRIKNGEVCYWPNMGYGKFGAKVTMAYAPVFQSPDVYSPQYLSLADISGTGAADLIYIGEKKCSVWINLAGNAWSEAMDINPLPGTDAYSKIAVLDFLGIGTGCLVWSSPLPQHATAPLQYIDLMCGVKPYLMTAYHSGMGKTVEVTYKSSTQFYLEDKKNGIKWATRLPFPVQCVEHITTSDSVSETAYTQCYKYRHGYYDHEEREFRGFGYVETLDIDTATVSDDEALDQPQVLTKTWYHTGAWLQNKKLSDQYQQEYYAVPFSESWEAAVLPDSETLSTQEWREAHRALKGAALRQEVYALDNTEKEDMPYTVTSTAYEVKLVQNKGNNRYASFRTQQQQSVAYSCERDLSDARIAQQLTLETDEYGNVRKSAAVVYPRLNPDASLPEEVRKAQALMHITYNRSNFTNDIADDVLHYRLRLPYEAQSFEVLGLSGPEGLWTVADLLKEIITASLSEIDISDIPGSGKKLRLLSHSRSLFQTNDADDTPLTGSIKLQSLAIPYEQYHLAYTDKTLGYCFDGKVDGAMAEEGGYIDLDSNGSYWLPSGRALFISPEERFYTPETYTDPWGNNTVVQFWDYFDEDNDVFVNYWLLPKCVIQSEGAINLSSSVEDYDWRILQPLRMMDANENISEILYDALGMPVATVMKGKDDESEGDELKTLSGDALQADTDDDLDLQVDFWTDPESTARQLLGRATWRCIYNLGSQPTAVAMIARENHYYSKEGGDSKVIIRISYSDGFGRVAMHKAQCTIPPGNTVTDLLHPENNGWIGSGKTVYNNKGNAVMQYEPYFSATHEYDFAEQALTDNAVSPKIYYDALGRVVKTEMPDKSFSDTEWTPWQQVVYDANDTVLDSGWRDDRIGSGIYASIDEEEDALDKTLQHADTPTVMHLDSLARPFYTAQYLTASTGSAPEVIASYVELDILGNRIYMVDGRGLTPLQYRYNYLKQPCYQESIDSGNAYTFTDVAGQPLYSWDAEDKRHNVTYDSLRRPLLHFCDAIMLEKTVYGEGQTDDTILNLRGQVYQRFDGSGRSEVPDGYDFKGNPLSSALYLPEDKTATDVDWSFSVDLESVAFTSNTVFDALNRPAKQTDPGANEHAFEYDRGGMLRSVLLNGDVYVADIHYDAKGQRQAIWYGNGTKTRYDYDEKTYRLRRLLTIKLSTNTALQDLNYYYDPVGNITMIRDEAQQDIFYDNTIVSAVQDFTYDALYRLIKAKGREQIGTDDFGSNDNWNDADWSVPLGSDAAQNYTQHYAYDAVGNILQLRHCAGSNSYTRDYVYDPHNNRLLSTTVGSHTYSYNDYDDRGNMQKFAHLDGIYWNKSNELNKVERSTISAYYQYSGGQRIRKWIDKGSIKEERIYLGNFEIYRKFDSGSSLIVARETIHVSDDTGRIAMLENRTYGSASDDSYTEAELVRYIYSNHLQSASLELDDEAEIISYEEYHPYGTTAFQANNSDINAVAKRYRYTGKERDEESGLYYHGARYYVPWLCRWCAVDPLESKYAGMSPYNYCLNNPIKYNDKDGKVVTDRDGIVAGLETAINDMIKAVNGFISNGTLPQGISAADANGYLRELNAVLSDINALRVSDVTYDIYKDSAFTDSGQGLVSYNKGTGNVDITFNNVSTNDIFLMAHEILHGVQYSQGGFSLKAQSRGAGDLTDITDEVEANNRQEALAGGLFSYSKRTVYTDVTLRQLVFPDGQQYYNLLPAGPLNINSQEGIKLKQDTLYAAAAGKPMDQLVEVYHGFELDYINGLKLKIDTMLAGKSGQPMNTLKEKYPGYELDYQKGVDEKNKNQSKIEDDIAEFQNNHQQKP